MKTIFIAWERYHARTDLLGRALGARVYFISHLGRVGGPRLLVKYWRQSSETLRILFRERPDVILAQTPPTFVAILATLYAALFRHARVILDVHSGSFLSRKWTWALPIQRWCARRAQMSIVHMRSLVPVVAGWGAAVMEIGYVFDERTPAPEAVPSLPPGTHIAAPCSFNPDEPIELIYAAARRAPDVTFHLTGDPVRLSQERREGRPENVVLTGYLSTPAYLGLLRAVDAVLALTTQDQTFQTAGAEAVWLGRPLILSDWPELRQVFTRGTVFVPHTVAGLLDGVRRVQACQADLANEIQLLKGEFDRALQAKYRRLRMIVEGQAPQPPPAGGWATDQETQA